MEPFLCDLILFFCYFFIVPDCSVFEGQLKAVFVCSVVDDRTALLFHRPLVVGCSNPPPLQGIINFYTIIVYLLCYVGKILILLLHFEQYFGVILLWL